MRQPGIICGASGGVGRDIIKGMIQDDGIDKQNNPTDIVGVADGTNIVINRHGIDPEILGIAAGTHDTMKNFLELRGIPFGSLLGIVDMAKSQGLDGEAIIIDATSMVPVQTAIDFHTKVLYDSQCYLVTANKDPLARSSMPEFRKLMERRGRYKYNTTVMAGAGRLIDWISRRHDIRDRVIALEGVISGTLNFICWKLEQGIPFSQCVREAQEAGYTETNPYHDLNGLDVMRKLLILCRSAGYSIEADEVEVEPLVDARFEHLTGEQFYEELQKEDARFTQLMTEAQAANETLRYTAKMKLENGKPNLSVKLRRIPKSSKFAMLTETENRVEVKTQSGYPLGIDGYGAGRLYTAQSIRSDIVDLLSPALPRR